MLGPLLLCTWFSFVSFSTKDQAHGFSSVKEIFYTTCSISFILNPEKEFTADLRWVSLDLQYIKIENPFFIIIPGF